jgi:hypothetical protein
MSGVGEFSPGIVNFPRVSRPRGLGYTQTGRALSGLGTWVVDTEYGLGPRFREGFATPYPPGVLMTRFPRANAARVLGPSGWSPVVARPFAPTRMQMQSYPVRKSPIVAQGARMGNPGSGMAGLGSLETLANAAQTASDVAGAMTQPGVFFPVAGGLALGIGGGAFGLPPAARRATGLAGLAAVAYGLYQAWREFTLRQAQSAPGSAAALRTGEIVTEIVAKPVMTEADKRVILSAFACYENARRAGGIRDPLKDCGLTAERAAMLESKFATIAPADRVRIYPALFGPGGSLQDFGVAA